MISLGEELLNKDSRIFVAGANGLVGSHIVRLLRDRGYSNVLSPARKDLDLTEGPKVRTFFEREKPEFVFMAAAKVGGILANSRYPVDFLETNLKIQENVISSAARTGSRKLLFLGSSCIYPKFAPQPIKEEALLTGPLEPTNEWYAIAKIAGIKLCQAYRRQYGFNAISLMPTNLYGPGDNFDLLGSHVLPALMRKFIEAKESGAGQVEVWGSGEPRREFLFVEDLAEACLFLMDRYDSEEIINVGTGEDIRIADLAEMIRRQVGFGGGIVYDRSKPDGTPRKILDVSKMRNLGWTAKTDLETGLTRTLEWYRTSVRDARK